MEKQNQWILTKIEALEAKVKKLVESHTLLKEELKESINENEVLRAIIEQKNEELKNFQNQFKISKIASFLSEDKKNASELRQKLNDYIKEVERGLAYLNRM